MRSCPRRPGSSATSSSTTSAARSSTPRTCASGSAARSALDTIGDACSCCSRATTRRSPSGSTPITGRLEGVAASSTRLADPRDRPAGPPLAGDRARDRGASCPALFDELVAAGDRRPRGPPSGAGSSRRRRAAPRSRSRRTPSGCEGPSPDGTDDWAIGRERHDALVAHRAFDGLDADQILELGWQKLAEEQAARVAAAREIDPDADEADGPRRHQGATARPTSAAPSRATGPRCCRARQHLIDHDLVDGPRRRADRRHRDARVPAQRRCRSRRTSRRRRSTSTPRASTS